MRCCSGRGQTAIEMMLIFGIMLAGLVVVLSSVSSTSSGTTLAYAARTSGSYACSYLQNGVVVNDTVYDPLNRLIEDNNYSPVQCRLLSVRVVESTSGYEVTLTFEYSGPDAGTFKTGVEEFVVLKMARYSGFELSDGVLLYRGSPVRVKVVVE